MLAELSEPLKDEGVDSPSEDGQQQKGFVPSGQSPSNDSSRKMLAELSEPLKDEGDDSPSEDGQQQKGFVPSGQAPRWASQPLLGAMAGLSVGPGVGSDSDSSSGDSNEGSLADSSHRRRRNSGQHTPTFNAKGQTAVEARSDSVCVDQRPISPLTPTPGGVSAAIGGSYGNTSDVQSHLAIQKDEDQLDRCQEDEKDVSRHMDDNARKPSRKDGEEQPEEELKTDVQGVRKLQQKSPAVNQAVNVAGQDPLTPAMLAAAPPQEQKQMLGERLFPLIQRMHPELAGKITGMLLEIDNAELLHMLESGESLKATVEEAVVVLQADQAKESAVEESKHQALHVAGQDPLTSAMLAAVPHQEQKWMLGERLFPLIQRIHRELAGKITGMLLEIDNAELLHMLESAESLKAKVEEAVAVLQAHQAKQNAAIQADDMKSVMGQMNEGRTRWDVLPTVKPQAAVQRNFFAAPQLPPMRAGPMWQTIKPPQPIGAGSGFSSTYVAPQAGQSNSATCQNQVPFVWQNVPPGMPMALINFPGRAPIAQPGVANMYTQQHMQPNYKYQPTYQVRNVPQGIHNPGVMQQQAPAVNQALHVAGQDPLTFSMLAAAPPQEQKQMLGERLFPLIQRMHPELAGKITAMLLEIDNAELLHMLESGESLKARVEEAVTVLNAHQDRENAASKNLQQEEAYALYSCEEGKRPENKLKNRYKNILPYDYTRVVLRDGDPDTPSQDYINANLITTEDDRLEPKKSYIATQGCLQATVVDFWRMAWQENVRVIVMTTKEVERDKIKAVRYWPSPEDPSDPEEKHMPVYKGKLIVKFISQFIEKDYTAREFELQREGADGRKEGPRKVYHYQFMAWPDYGVPGDPESVLNFLKIVNIKQESVPGAGPVVVHCCAGIGRTGTFIAIDMILNQIKTFGLDCEIDIQETIESVRSQRSARRQTEALRNFVCLAVHHYIEREKQRSLAEQASR